MWELRPSGWRGRVKFAPAQTAKAGGRSGQTEEVARRRSAAANDGAK